ncbi:MAG: hypothetical protein KUL77_05505 [Thermomonas sp.]|uniref:hypothetical protein n=1 Tax=Thermomonas sp. TaxID=1971895 RepID=UPI001EC1DF7D|nr:hypothetical protein [Thermomonas sp.]MBV2208998.1 hypothetical protein [Thermomonas sp.]
MHKHIAFAVAIGLTLVACKGEDPEAAARAAAAPVAAQEQAAEAMEKQFDAAVAASNWRLAKGYGDVLQMDHPGTTAADRVKGKLADVQAKAAAEGEQQRLEALWSYGDVPAPGGRQLSASIYAEKEVAVDGSGEKPVQLIFRDHPEWGRSSYLVLKAGDFDCYKGCKLKVTLDGKTYTLPGTRPKTDEAIAMFIDDHKQLWKLAKTGKQLTIEFPTKQVGKRSATFEVGGLKPAHLPKWN